MDDGSLPKTKKHSQLTQEKFDQLLFALNPDRMAAAEMYEHIRWALITFFSCRGAANPDELTDETFNRVASRLSDGAEIFAHNPTSYFYGFARNIWREMLAKPTKLQQLDERLPHEKNLTPNPHELMEQAHERITFEQRLTHLNRCLEGLPVKDRDLLIEYYQEAGAGKIEHRQALATRFGISLKTLRNKTTLLRGKLTHCMKKSLSAEN